MQLTKKRRNYNNIFSDSFLCCLFRHIMVQLYFLNMHNIACDIFYEFRYIMLLNILIYNNGVLGQSIWAIILLILSESTKICEPEHLWDMVTCSIPVWKEASDGLQYVNVISGCAQKLVDERCQVHSLVAFVNLAFRSFPWFSPKLA